MNLQQTMQTKVESKRSLSQQLFEAYTASLKQAEEENLHAKMSHLDPDSDNVHIFKEEREAFASLPLVNSSGINIVSAQSENLNVTTSPTLYQSDASTLEAWKQIGDLANDVGYSAIVRQAEILNDLARRDFRIREESIFLQHRQQEEMETNTKKRKFEDAMRLENISNKNIKKIVVSESSEEEGADDSTCDDEAVAVSSLSSSSMARHDSHDDILQEHVNRIIRMTTYVSEMERIHDLMRKEMQAMMGYQEG